MSTEPNLGSSGLIESKTHSSKIHVKRYFIHVFQFIHHAFNISHDKITSLTAEIETLQQDKFSLISRIGKQEKEKEATQAEITKLKESLESAGAEHKAALDREGTLTDKLEVLLEEKKSMSSSMDEKEGLIKENNQKLELINSDFATLKSDHEKVNLLEVYIYT